VEIKRLFYLGLVRVLIPAQTALSCCVNKLVKGFYMFEQYLSIQRFQVKLDTSTIRHKALYANGRMQVRVLVLVSGENSNAEEVSLYGHPALETLKLISYDTSAPLDGSWSVGTKENRYAHDMSGGAARVLPLVPAPDNRISDPSERVQIFEFWVTSSRPGSIQIAAEITLQGVKYRSDGRNGYDSSVTLEAIAPKQYPISNFVMKKTRVLDLPSLFERTELHSLSLHAEGRQINLLDWASFDARYDEEFATEFFSSGNALNLSPGVRNYVAFIGPIYGVQVTARTSTGFRSLAQDPGTISILSHLTQDYPNKPARTAQLNLQVFDEYGTEHNVRINPDIANRSYILS
jgi:hypothetical protein